MRFYASHLGSGLWGLYDGGVMTWLASDLSENEAKQQAADRNVIFDQWGQRQERERRQVAEAWWQAPSATPADEEVLVERIDLWYGELLKDGRYVAVTSFLWYAEPGSTGTRSMPR